MATPETVFVVGMWHLGIVNAVGFAEAGYQVVGLEFDAKKVASLNAGKPPLYEPGLEALLNKHLRSGRLSFSVSAQDSATADYLVIALDSPVNEKDAVDIKPVLEAAQAVAIHLGTKTPLVITSQIPVGTSEKIEARVQALNPAWESGVVYTPENLKLGEAIERFLRPDMLVLGTGNAVAKQAVAKLYRPMRTKKVWTDSRTAEMVKHALNAYLATSISFINEIAQLSDNLGVDAVVVGQALKLDKRIGKRALLSPGLGYSGGTLARDVELLKTFTKGSKTATELLKAVTQVNDNTFGHVVAQLQHILGSLKGKRIGLMGLTYKSGTSTMRRSPAISLMQKLVKASADCYAYDPQASQAEADSYSSLFTRVNGTKELAQKVDILVLVTSWPEFQDLNYSSLAKYMRQPIIVDTKNALDPATLEAAGFTYVGFGRYSTIKIYEKHCHHRSRVASRTSVAGPARG